MGSATRRWGLDGPGGLSAGVLKVAYGAGWSDDRRDHASRDDVSARAQRRLAEVWPGRPTPEWITGQLAKLLRGGATPRGLRTYAPDLVDVLCPPESNSNYTARQRSSRAAEVIRAAILEADMDYARQNVGEALLYLFGLARGACLDGTRTSERTRYAADILGVLPRTFQKLYQDGYLENVADKIFDMVA